MATLEKIRQRKKILAIVIGAALLAFIIEVGIEALGRQASNSTAAKVGSEKIDIMTFQKRVEKESAAEQRRDPNAKTDPALRQQQVLDEMINEKLLENEYDEVGIFVSDNEISQLMIGDKPAQAAVQFAQQGGFESPAQVYDLLNNPSKYQVQPEQLVDLRNSWEELQKQITDQLRFAKLQALVAGSLQANDLDREQMTEDEALTTVINFVKKDVTSLPDDKFEPTDEEVKAEWTRLKPMFKLDEKARRVHYIALNLTPSPDDVRAAEKVVENAFAALQKGRGIDSVRVLGTVGIDTAVMALDKVPAQVKDFVASAAVGECKRMDPVNNKYNMYKLINKFASVDSVNINFVVVPGSKAVQDSALAQLNAGKPVEELEKSVKGLQSQMDLWQQIAAAPDSTKAKITNAGSNYVVLFSSPEGAQIIKVNEIKPAKTFYTLATVSYEAYASTKTIDEQRSKLQNFLNKNKRASEFAENAAKAGFQAIETTLSESTPQLGMNPYTGTGIRDTRKAIKWAFDNKEGAVSPIFSDNNDMLVALAIDAQYEGDYMPFNHPQVRKMIDARIIANKKVAALMKQYDGKAKDLAGYAAVMGVSVDTTQVVFASDVAPKLENEPALVGRVAAMKPGQFSGLWKGENGVYAFQVVKQDKEKREVTKEELNNRFAQTRGAGLLSNPRMLYSILGKSTKVKKSLINFY